MGELEEKISRTRGSSSTKKKGTSRSQGKLKGFSISNLNSANTALIGLAVVLVLGLWYGYKSGWICDRLCRWRRRRARRRSC
ncbi:jg23847 [Pararge aegeria aegeria]|uniref:Jg23847 protein n=1 Tax=Pararge aegeria aegeria TaxID=348720 RepID=A0A8S4R107_9NEOP|nr:jg23847 [Pararge aegeria aegeria]